MHAIIVSQDFMLPSRLTEPDERLADYLGQSQVHRYPWEEKDWSFRPGVTLKGMLGYLEQDIDLRERWQALKGTAKGLGHNFGADVTLVFYFPQNTCVPTRTICLMAQAALHWPRVVVLSARYGTGGDDPRAQAVDAMLEHLVAHGRPVEHFGDVTAYIGDLKLKAKAKAAA